MTLPRTGQRNDGSALVVSLGFALAAGSAGFSSTCTLDCARRALCCGAAGVIERGGGGKAASCCCCAGAATAGAGSAAALLLLGTVSFMPMLSLAEWSRLLALAS